MAINDLNLQAATTMRDLIASDTALLPEWKQVAMTLLAKGVPENLDAMKKLLDAELETGDAEDQATAC
jgi:hypothetical protein